MSLRRIVRCSLQIRFWRTNDPDNFRTEDVILQPWTPCRPVPNTPSTPGRQTRSAEDDGEAVGGSTRRVSSGGRSGRERVRAITTNLWPYSTITAGVLVLNGARIGNISNTITFETPEGGSTKKFARVKNFLLNGTWGESSAALKSGDN